MPDVVLEMAGVCKGVLTGLRTGTAATESVERMEDLRLKEELEEAPVEELRKSIGGLSLSELADGSKASGPLSSTLLLPAEVDLSIVLAPPLPVSCAWVSVT